MNSLSVEIASPKDIARYFMFLKRDNDLNFGKVMFKNISAKMLYDKNHDIFKKLFKISSKYHIDLKKYISFYALELGKSEFSIPYDLLSVNTLNLYCEHLKIDEQYQRIYNYFMKSVDHIVGVCLENGYPDVKEYLKRLVLKNQLASKVVSGQISIYYLASISNIVDLIAKMDSINRDELKIVTNRKEELNSTVQNAFMHLKAHRINPISFTNKVLWEKRKNGTI